MYGFAFEDCIRYYYRQYIAIAANLIADTEESCLCVCVCECECDPAFYCAGAAALPWQRSRESRRRVC